METLQEKLGKIVDIAMEDNTSFSNIEDKINIIAGLCDEIEILFLEKLGGVKTQDAEPNFDENDEDEENKEDNEISDDCGKRTQDSAEELAGLINDLVDEKLEQFKDNQKTELKAINDAYSEVSEALGTSFDCNGMSRDELYKFGYETITGAKLADDMDAVTAFKLANAHSKPAQKIEDSAPVENESSILKALKNF